jgi:hypothetical protein
MLAASEEAALVRRWEENRMGTQTRRVVFFVAELIIVSAMLLGSGSLSVVPSVLAQGMHPARRAPHTGPDVSRFQPLIHAPKLPVTQWHPRKTSKPPTLQHSAPQTPGPAGPPLTPGEQPDLRQQNVQTFYNKDGTYTAKLYPRPVNYQDAHGNWQPIDERVVTPLAADESGSGQELAPGPDMIG